MTLHVEAAGALVTVQDRGRTGFAHLGVPRAGALDAPAAELANRLVGNDPGAAVLEVVLGGLTLRVDRGCWVAATGAPAPMRVADVPRGHARAEWLPAGARLSIGTPRTGLRTYLAVAGGVAVDPVLGSRSTDTLAWVGPEPVVAGTVLPIGEPSGPPRPLDTPPAPRRGPLGIVPGPRADWFDAGAMEVLCSAPYVVMADSDRVGLRLAGPPLPRVRSDELASEGMVVGAVQVPPSGLPVVLLADHPPTGGYPVIGVVAPGDLWRCAQARPGESVRFTALGPLPPPRRARADATG